MKQGNMQEVFLNSLRKNNTFVTVFLLNGFQLKGLIKSYDNFTVLLESDGKQQLITNTRFQHLFLQNRLRKRRRIKKGTGRISLFLFYGLRYIKHCNFHYRDHFLIRFWRIIYYTLSKERVEK